MKILKINVVIAIAITLINSSMAFAWNDKITHRALTDRAIQNLQGIGWLVPYLQNNLGFKKHVEEVLNNGKENKKIVDLLLEGSEREDDWDGMRFQNHFHEPITNRGLNQGWLVNGESALAWARGTGEGCVESGECLGNEYSWSKARQYYSEAFEALSQPDTDTRQAELEAKMAETFRSLGQIMHMIQDMAVPAHTRNDMQGAGRVSAA